MPTVPIYQRRASLIGAVPYAQAGFVVAGMPGQAVSEAGEAITREADRYLEARRVNELSQRTLEAAQDLDALDAWVSNEPEWDKIVPGYEAKIAELRTKYKDQITDPAVRNLFTRDFEKMAIRGQAEARGVAKKREKDHNQATLLGTLDVYSDLVAQAPTFEKAAERVGYARSAIAGAVAAGTIDEMTGVKMDKDFVEKSQVNFIQREMLDDPEGVYKGLIEGKYPELDEARKTQLLKQSQDRAEAVERDRIRTIEHAEKQAEKAKKDAQENNYGDALTLYSQGKLTEASVQQLISSRRIDPDKGSHLISLLRTEEKRGDKGVNNPRVVGDLSTRLELGADITGDLDAALEKDQIKADTYVALKKQMADRDFKRGLYHVNYALKPSEADQWTPDKHIRHAEAVEEYTSRVAAGENPIAVSKSIIETFTSDVRRTIRGIPSPRFLAGEKTDIDALREAQRKTADAFKKGTLSSEDFNRESDRLQLLMDLVTRLNQNTEAMPADDDRAKKALKK